MDSLLIIDDEPTVRKLLARIMELEGYDVIQAEDCASGLRKCKQCNPEVILCDVFLPDGNGVEMVSDIKKILPQSEIILLTARGSIADGVQSIKNGAYDYITKGDDNNKIIPLVSTAMAQAKRNIANANPNVLHSFDTIIGESECLKQTIRMAKKVANTDVTVLLTGETGTGKDVFAQAIHKGSNRSKGEFVPVNCASFSRELLESELFGYKAGSFTGANKDKQGLLEVANGGTIFLDEIGEMPFDLQAKLLRVLESGEYLKIGSTKASHVDVRVISATNRNLKEEVAKGTFREDLYYRLSVFQIQLPPLRERTGDIEMLAKAFLERLDSKMNKKVDGMTPEFIAALNNAEWHGNVRELRNVIEHSAIVCEGKLTLQDLPMDLQNSSMTDSGNSALDLATIERRHIIKVLQYTKGNKTEASRLLKIGLTTLYRKIEEYKIVL